MAPRNNDASTSYKKKNFPAEDNEMDVKDIVPCLLHKKHKVVKLVKSQLQKIQEEGLICDTIGQDIEINISEEDEKAEATRRRTREIKETRETRRGEALNDGRQALNDGRQALNDGRQALNDGRQALNDGRQSSSRSENLSTTSEYRGNVCMCMYFIAVLLTLFFILFLMVFISAGPLSRTMAHTPIPVNCFVRTDSLCTLERKYLLRWSKPEYFE